MSPRFLYACGSLSLIATCASTVPARGQLEFREVNSVRPVSTESQTDEAAEDARLKQFSPYA